MSAESAKRRIKANKKIVASWARILVGGNALGIGLCFLLKKRFVTFLGLATLILECGVFALLRTISTPTVIKTQKQMEIKYEGADLSSRGVASILQDVLYISLLVKVSSLFFRYAWTLFFLVPVSAYYEIFLKKRSPPKKTPEHKA
ncbi:hypothetical protein NECID01_0789 [Nematocida sp. AWRm77]|nr:hypothetical protein NECID01_0789 [Nematocida sp. AWRm77]